jgi:hypothetical protein
MVPPVLAMEKKNVDPSAAYVRRLDVINRGFGYISHPITEDMKLINVVDTTQITSSASYQKSYLRLSRPESGSWFVLTKPMRK